MTSKEHHKDNNATLQMDNAIGAPEPDELQLDMIPDIEQWQTEAEEVLATATQDSDQWVSMLAEMMQTLPATGSLNTDVGKVQENEKIFVDLIDELKELLKKNLDPDLLPLECHYLNRTALGQMVQPERHFRLRRRPRAVTLRADLLRKAEDASVQLARHAAAAAVGAPLRSRSAPRRPDSAGLSGRSAGGQHGLASGDRRRSLSSSSSAPHQARSVKMLDIADQPASLQHTKRRRRTAARADAERASASRPVDGAAPAREAAAPAEEEAQQPVAAAAAAAATPDYAAGLQTTHLPVPTSADLPTPAPAPAPTSPPVPVPPSSHTAVSAEPSSGVPEMGPALGPGSQPQRPAPAMYTPQPQQPLIAAAGLSQPTADQPQLQILTGRMEAAGGSELPQPKLTMTTQPPQTTLGGGPHLTLTREQMLKAQEMFSTANRVTRPEKALILGFIAGSRDNPCPDLGEVVTVKLSESAERLAAVDSGQGGAAVVAETHFQMNYATGEWKRIKKFRRADKTVD